MPEYNGPEDIYRELVEESDENWLYGLVAFAVIEEQRIEWMKHMQENMGHAPSPEQISNWYQQQPPNCLLRAKGTAENALQTYSSEVIEVAIDDYKKEIEESYIVNEIRGLKNFWPQFGVNLAGGLAATVLFAALLSVTAFVVFNDSSPVQMVRGVNDSAEEPENGQEN
ncbi:hypothetical protein [Vreelandella sedimenti]|uniref:hypothetical protein n=1 Tax=Vreelandella sedimenti TaxID=2729618 RepID=UPI00257F0951|nr:hypothetical protein [Halomonas sp. UBA3173]|tara:strand:+ start:52837 stop:53343 length:507 start_codon:yes stop_codon:yes gene_type:complete